MSSKKQKKKRKHKSHNTVKTTPHTDERTARFGARFWRYYYWFLIVGILYLIGNKYIFIIGTCLAMMFHGIYLNYMRIKMPRHFILFMLDLEHKEIKNARQNYNPVQIKEWQHDAKTFALIEIIFGGIFSIILTILCISS